MQGDFKLEDVPRECQTLFSHADAEARFGASIFWLRDGMLSEEMADEFLDTWQTKGMVQNAVCRGDEMIKNEMELAVTRERLAKMERFLEELRKTARPEEWPALSSGYRLEMERMQGEILDFLATPVSSGRAFA